MKNSSLSATLILAILSAILGCFLVFESPCFALTESLSPPSNTLYQPKPMDGVVIDAVEDYPNPLGSDLGLGVGLYPFNSYYTGLILNGSYRYNIDRKLSWEILNASYAYTFDKDVTTQLADRFGVSPQQIDRLNFLLSSNIMDTLADGKFVLLDNYIRYFRASALGGLGMVMSTQTKSIALSAGIRMEVFTSRSFSWRLDIRDLMAFRGFDHFVTFTLGTGFSF